MTTGMNARLKAICQDNLGKPVSECLHFPDFIGAKDEGDGGDNWSYKMHKDPVKLSLPTN